MARYTGPKVRISRRLGVNVFENTKGSKALERRPFPPGTHGRTRRRGAGSEYLLQLQEKQKAKYTYGVLERQFRKTFVNATRKHGVTGEVLLQLLEARLDNTVFRMGISPTRKGARQLVSHRHITVNGKVVNIPSYSLKPGDVVAIRGKSRNLDCITISVGGKTSDVRKYPWIEWNPDKASGIFLTYPQRDTIPEKINEQLIVELYSK